MSRTLDVVNAQNEKVDEVTLSPAVFEAPVKGHLLHEAVRWQRTRQRRGTASTKGRAEVSGGGKKRSEERRVGKECRL